MLKQAGNQVQYFLCKKEGNIAWETPQSTRVTASSLQAGRHQPSWDSAASKEASAIPPNSNPPSKGLSQEGSNPQSINSLVPPQAGR